MKLKSERLLIYIEVMTHNKISYNERGIIMDNNNEKEMLINYLFDESIPEEEMTKRQWRILEAAIKVFSEKGFEGSRTSDIAKEAEVAEGTIFRYYKTKKDLLLGLLLPMTSKFFRPLIMRSIERIIDDNTDKPIEQILEEILMDRLTLIKKNAPLMKTVLIEAMYHPELLEPIRKDIMPKVLTFIDKFMEQRIDGGEFRDFEPRDITRTLMSLLIGFVVLTNLFPDLFKYEDDRKEMKKIADILVNGIKNK
jgi:AcrR family transcriptional regulator